jgi:hypothetical protein
MKISSKFKRILDPILVHVRKLIHTRTKTQTKYIKIFYFVQTLVNLIILLR